MYSLVAIPWLILVAMLLMLAYQLGRRRPAPALQGSALQAETPTPARGKVRIGLYNIHRARGTDGRKDLQRIAEVMRREDLVGLCEVEGAGLPGQADQCSKLGAMLQMLHLFSPTQKRWGRYDRGNGLLSRYSLNRWSQEPLRDSTGTHPRSLLRADLDIDGEEIPLFVTHLARRIDQAEQLQTVFSRFRQYERAVLVGDLNLVRASPLLQDLLACPETTDALAQVLEDDEPQRIDWIFTRGFKVTGGGAHPLGPSDHPYYWIELELQPEADKPAKAGFTP